jgi:anaerobic selenocysteine-containing dehydrogenase
MEQRTTFCRICEALCGLTATVEDGRLIEIRPSKEHPISQGFACPKGIAMHEVVNDPDRLLYPLRRKSGVPRGAGGMDAFERVSWEEALDDIGVRLKRVIDAHGGHSVGAYVGNPAYFSYSAPMWMQGFLDALGSKHLYTPGSQDTASRFAASALLYGTPFTIPLPDLYNTDFLLVVGANPLVSHGSMLNAKRLPYAFRDIPRRGGRLIVVDPRRTETAKIGEHIPIRPDTDAWMLLAMLNVIFTEGLEDSEAIARQATGVEAVKRLCAAHTPESTEARTKVPAETVRALARDLATAPTAAVYGRCGSNRGRHGTLVAYLLDVLNLVTGNLDRRGGAVVADSPIPKSFLKNIDTYGARHTRIGGYPDAFGQMCSAVIGKEMLTPGEGQMRAFFTIAGNPLLTAPNGDEIARGIEQLDLYVAIDIYVSDTAQYADYVLPATTFMEREDTNLITQTFHLSPHLEWTDPVVPPRGEARQEWEIIDAIARRVGVVPSSEPAMRFLGRLGVRPKPSTLIDMAIRMGSRGDLFGLRPGGLSIKKLRKTPEGVAFGDHPTGHLAKRVRHPRGLVRLDPPEIMREAAGLGGRHPDDERYPMLLIGLREIRSHNSWMHNSPKLMLGRHENTALVHPKDAAAAGVADGDLLRITSKTNSVELPVRVTDEIIEGTVAVPHGWGHSGGWRTASANPGTNINLLVSSEPEDIEQLAGMALLDGIPIRIEAAVLTCVHAIH